MFSEVYYLMAAIQINYLHSALNSNKAVKELRENGSKSSSADSYHKEDAHTAVLNSANKALLSSAV